MESKEGYREKMEAKLAQWNAEMDKLSAKLSEAKADVKISYAEKIEEFMAKRDALKEQMDELRGSGDEAWQRIKIGVDNAASDLLKALDKAKSSLH